MSDNPTKSNHLNQQTVNDIKTKAIVKYAVPKPPSFHQLPRNTDLNNPPTNWLSNTGEMYGLQHVVFQHKEFASFRMAQMFPDCVGSVDVVSDSENIKKLLKIPYAKGHISMMVHRVENTLLLDDFDVYKYLLRATEKDWEWMKKFFYKHVISDPKNLMYTKENRLKALQQRTLTSKFLYHSLGLEETGTVQEHEYLNTAEDRSSPPHDLPEPSRTQEVPDPGSFDHKYNRNVVWTFEDIEMLIGTDMPIFGGGTHPCISLRLRDMNKPINVLTGIDYWLDNLMSNVPEVVMCYHLNGIVQKYELIKTEDLPGLKDSKFSPKLIRDVAQSILSFLKSNATKSGHTYWLFKGKNEDIVKLYDLSCLCSDEMVEKSQNPFTVPVAMLLYRVARNMKHSDDSPQAGNIRMLLKNCIKLLEEKKYPEIVTSSHYMLSDLYIPASTDPNNPKIEDEEFDDNDDYLDDEDDGNLSDAMKYLVLNDKSDKTKEGNKYKMPPPLVGTIEERCEQAIIHVAAGLNCLQYFATDEEKEDETTEAEYNIPMANSSEPIPMPYKEKKKKKKAKKKTDKEENALLLKPATEASPMPTWQGSPPYSNNWWKSHLKILLYEKAMLVYALLSEQNFGTERYGTSLRYIGLLTRCSIIMKKFHNAEGVFNTSTMLSRAGDCCMMISQSWIKSEDYIEQFHAKPENDLIMLEQIERDERYV